MSADPFQRHHEYPPMLGPLEDWPAKSSAESALLPTTDAERILGFNHQTVARWGAAAEIADALDIGISHINRTCEDMENASERLKDERAG